MLSDLQAHLQAVYRVDAPDVQAFLVDDAALAEIIGADARPADEWVLARETPEGVDLAVWIQPNHLTALAAAGTPARAANDCFSALCAAVEGVSHFLMLVHRSRTGEPVRLLELEAQAEVDKFVCALLHHPDRAQEWQSRLFRDVELHAGLQPHERDRYIEAGRLAEAWCANLATMPHSAAVLRAQREFWRASGHQRMDWMRKLAA